MMIKLSINLPPSHRLDLKLTKAKREDHSEPIIPSIKKLRRARSGHKISRFFRHIFEHKSLKKILALQLPVFILLSSAAPKISYAGSIEPKNEQVIIAIEKTSIKTQSGVEFPLEKVQINQGYHFFHPGIDFEGITGDTVEPIMGGYIEHIQYSRYAYGNAVIVNHGNNTTSLYAHLSQISVVEGQKVTTDTKLGEVGNTGRSFGDHLHLEVHESGVPINPLSVLPKISRQ